MNLLRCLSAADLPGVLTTLTALIPPALTILIGVFVAFVGYQQYTVNRAKLKLDLFEKRFAIYKGTQVFLSSVLHDAKVEMDELFRFRGATQDAVFLFGDDIRKFLSAIDTRGLRLWRITQELEGVPVGDKRSSLCKEQSEILEALIDDLPRLKEVFGPYLAFKKWR
jgi:hypothetical protein